MNCSVVSVFTNLHCADCVCLYSTHLAGFLLREMFRARYGPVWTRFSLILGTRLSILETQIGSLKRLNKTLDLVFVIHKEIHLFLQLI